MSKHKKKIDGVLDRVDPKHIVRSKENPRSEDFFKDKNFLRLKESVAKFGVIVPVIIKHFPNRRDGKKYQLIDGERRWRAAIETNQDKIPAYVLPAEKHIKVLATMFQIHMNQQGWDPTEQARALEATIVDLMSKIEQKDKTADIKQIEEELVKQLIDITGTDR
ncbi:MAG: ParB/RepB/Spo0J family partition protein, partial [Candidatus Brocadiales bacterium]